MGKRVSQVLTEVPGVVSVGQFVGRASLSDDTWGPEVSEFNVTLDPHLSNYTAVTEQIRAHLATIPGVSFNVLSYLKERMEEVMSGATAQVVVKIFGSDLGTLRQLGQHVGCMLPELAQRAKVGAKDLDHHLCCRP